MKTGRLGTRSFWTAGAWHGGPPTSEQGLSQSPLGPVGTSQPNGYQGCGPSEAGERMVTAWSPRVPWRMQLRVSLTLLTWKFSASPRTLLPGHGPLSGSLSGELCLCLRVKAHRHFFLLPSLLETDPTLQRWWGGNPGLEAVCPVSLPSQQPPTFLHRPPPMLLHLRDPSSL